MMDLHRILRWTAAASTILTLTLAACAPDDGERPVSPTAPRALLPTLTSLLRCPTSQELSVSGTVLPDSGGSLVVGKWRLDVPPGAVDEPTQITMRVPAGNYVQVEFTANGAEHLQFRRPVAVTASYERCLLPPPGTLIVWYWDPASGRIIEPMPTFNNLLTRTARFWTDHFSGFVIAN